ncbi:MAG: single-stranded DNA-binding protein [Desulfovibrio sp.]|nr:single-stranded DNA-binding protein [Desulfovibrio sp.]
MLNRVMLIGRLGRDPELRYTTNGTPVCSLSIATDESYIDRDGNRVERTEWHRVSVFQRQAENCSQYLSKGSLVYVEGQLQTRKYQDQQGQERFVTDIRGQRVVFLERKGDRPYQGQGDRPYGDRQPYQNRYQGPNDRAPYGGHGGYQQQHSQAPAAPAAPVAPQPAHQDLQSDLAPSEDAAASSGASAGSGHANEEKATIFPTEANMDQVPF